MGAIDEQWSFDLTQQVRVGAIFLRDGRALLHRLMPESLWAVPGGRLEAGETAREAIRREMREELGIDRLPGPLRAVVETRFTRGASRVAEVGLYFLIDPTGLPDGPFVRAEDDKRFEFRWFGLTELGSTDLRPASLVEVLMSPDDRILHLVDRDQ